MLQLHHVRKSLQPAVAGVVSRTSHTDSHFRRSWWHFFQKTPAAHARCVAQSRPRESLWPSLHSAEGWLPFTWPPPGNRSMAKWGEGDPRWVVEHREDGKNVNAWHWSESSKLSWCKARLEQQLPGLELGTAAPAKLSVKSVKSVTGEASISIRKGNKKLVLYDLSITCLWEGQLAGSEKSVEGEWKIDEFSSGSEEDDYVFTVTAVGTGSEQDELKRLADAGFREAIVPLLQSMIIELGDMQ